MSSQGFGSLERDVLRERERAARERALLLGKMQETSPPPIFSEPIKVDPSLEDETSKRVKSTLGDFHGILNTDPKNLIGISRSGLMAIHNSRSSSSGTGYSSSSKSNDGNSDAARKSNVLNGQHKSSHWNTHDTETKHLSISTHQRSRDYTKTQNVDNKLKKKIQLSKSNSSSAVGGETLDKDRSSSYKSKKSSAFQNIEKVPSDNLCEEQLTGKTVDIPVKENAAVTEQAEYKNDKQPQVESILEEMRLNIPPPLTAICSPGRDEPFHFPINEEPVVPFNAQESDHSAGVEQCTDSTNSLIMLREDLAVSESDEEMCHDKLTDPEMLFNSALESPDLNSLHPPPPVDAMSSSAKSSGESEMSEPEIAISVPSNESAKKSTKMAKVARQSEKKHKSSRQRNDKERSPGLKEEIENEKTASVVTYDRGERTKTSQEKEKSLSPLLSDLEMKLVHDAISEETLAVCPPIQPICVSPMSPIGHNSQETGPSLSSLTEKSGKSSTVIHKEKTSKKKRSDPSRSSDSHALLLPSCGDNKAVADPTITAPLPTNSAAVSCDGVKNDSEKSRRHKHKMEKKEVKDKHLKSEENKKLHKRTNSSEKKTQELSSRNSTPKQLPKVEEESKVPKGNDAQKRKANFHRPKSKKFISDSSDDSDSIDSDFEKPTREMALAAKTSGQKTSRNNVESMPVKSSCLAKPNDEQATLCHMELKAKEPLKRVPTGTISSKNVAVVTPIVLDKTVKELSFDKSANAQPSLDKPLCTESPSLKPSKCQSQVYVNINESHHSTIPSFLVSIDLKYIERLPKLKEHNKHCDKKEIKAENNLSTCNDSHLSQTEEKVSKESFKRKHSEEKKYKHKKLKVTPTPSPKTTLPVKKEKPGDEFWDAKITPKSSERCDSPSSLCSFSSQQSHRSITHHGQGKSSDRSKKEKKTKDSSLSEQKLKGHTPSKEYKLNDDRKHKLRKDESIKSKEKSKCGGKYQPFENSQESGLAKSSQVYKAENGYREATRQDECANVSHDDLAEWNNLNSSWLLPKQGMIECDKYMNEAKKLKHEADMENDFRVQAMKYLDAVLCFILAAMAKEKSLCQVSQSYNLYKETLDLIRYIASKFQKNAQSSSQNGSMDTKLYVLSLRCQSLLYLKLYRLRRGEVREIHKTLSKVQKQKPNHRPLQTTPVTTLSQPSPGHLKGGMPSPHSPTPSPAGSVASVGSQSSGYSSSEVNGAQCRNVNTDSIINNPLPSVPSGHQQASQDHHDVVSVPHSTYNMLQRQSTHLGNLHLCHDLWEQADIHISHGNCKEFFKLLDSKCGRLTLHSTFPELVEYIRKGLGMLKEET